MTQKELQKIKDLLESGEEKDITKRILLTLLYDILNEQYQNSVDMIKIKYHLGIQNHHV